MFPSKDVCENFMKVTYWFTKNTTSKNAFLAVCLYLDVTIDLHEGTSRAPFGGKIGVGDSLLHNYLKFSKISRMHANFHDAHGFMRSLKKSDLVTFIQKQLKSTLGAACNWAIFREFYFGR